MHPLYAADLTAAGQPLRAEVNFTAADAPHASAVNFPPCAVR